MLACFQKTKTKNSIPLEIVFSSQFSSWQKNQPAPTKAWVKRSGFKAHHLEINIIYKKSGEIEKILCGLSDKERIFSLRSLPLSLPEKTYYIENNNLEGQTLQQAILAWGIGSYQFERYKSSRRQPAKLVIPKSCDAAFINNIVSTDGFVRDLMNTPANDLTPHDLAQLTGFIAKEHHAMAKEIVGKDLLLTQHNAIYAVGKASSTEPRLIDLTWGDKNHPKITIIGKGVCFDSGGLNIKPTDGMAIMKKDMGGAAHALGLARMIMDTKLPIRLRVLIPAVENMISGDAYRPGDVIKMHNGKTVEITNTDAEGRLILADALSTASLDKPDLIIDLATLTGAATVALGADIAALFSNNESLQNSILAFAKQEHDPMWPMPLYAPYRKLLDSKIADMTNAASKPMGGAITAALFLKEFVDDNISWIHLDLRGWNDNDQCAEMVTIRALFSYLKSVYSKKH